MVWQGEGTLMKLWRNPIYVILIAWVLTTLGLCQGQSQPSPGPTSAATNFTPFQTFWRNDFLWLNATVQANAAINECGCLATFQAVLQKKHEVAYSNGCGQDLDKALNDTSQTGGLNCCLNGGPDKSGECQQLALDFVNNHSVLPPPTKYVGTQAYGGDDSILPDLSSLGTNANNNKGGLSAGAIAGIVVGVVLGLALVAIIAGLLWRRQRLRKRKSCIEAGELFNLNPSSGMYNSTSSSAKHDVVNLDSCSLNVLSLEEKAFGTMSIEHTGSSSGVSFDGVPESWQIKTSEVKLYCVDGRPVVLGTGGHGIVLYGTVFREDAAIKMIAGRQKNHEEALLKEIAIMDQAKSEYVVRFLGYSVCQDDGLLLCMEFMSGGTLYKALEKDDQFQWYKRGKGAIKDIANGLFSLHKRGLAHLDMKSPNVLLNEQGRCKISDLGLSRLMNKNETCTMNQVGTFLWLAPEVIVGGRIGFAADIFAFGTIMWEVVTLKRPARDIWGEADIRINQDAPQDLVDLIVACRETDPKDRPNIKEICDILDKME